MARDTAAERRLKELGWAVVVVWECELANVYLRDSLAIKLKDRISLNEGR